MAARTQYAAVRCQDGEQIGKDCKVVGVCVNVEGVEEICEDAVC